MSKLKKATLIVFTMLFIFNLQINTSITEGLNGDFSLAQMAENIFIQSAYATGGYPPYCQAALAECIASCPGYLSPWCEIGCAIGYLSCGG